MPPEINMAPRRSSRAGCATFAGLEMSVRTTAMIATGMLTQKIARQVISVR